jgi:hypothetical protein
MDISSPNAHQFKKFRENRGVAHPCSIVRKRKGTQELFRGAWRGAGSVGSSGLFGFFGLSGSENEINEINQLDCL